MDKRIVVQGQSWKKSTRPQLKIIKRKKRKRKKEKIRRAAFHERNKWRHM
jgi:hypothetical protein